MSGQIAALERALRAMEGVTKFVTSRERINRPTGENWWQEEINAAREALSLPPIRDTARDKDLRQKNSRLPKWLSLIGNFGRSGRI